MEAMFDGAGGADQIGKGLIGPGALDLVDVVPGDHGLILGDEVIDDLGAVGVGEAMHAADVIFGVAAEGHDVILHGRTVVRATESEAIEQEAIDLGGALGQLPPPVFGPGHGHGAGAEGADPLTDVGPDVHVGAEVCAGEDGLAGVGLFDLPGFCGEFLVPELVAEIGGFVEVEGLVGQGGDDGDVLPLLVSGQVAGLGGGVVGHQVEGVESPGFEVCAEAGVLLFDRGVEVNGNFVTVIAFDDVLGVAEDFAHLRVIAGFEDELCGDAAGVGEVLDDVELCGECFFEGVDAGDDVGLGGDEQAEGGERGLTTVPDAVAKHPGVGAIAALTGQFGFVDGDAADDAGAGSLGDVGDEVEAGGFGFGLDATKDGGEVGVTAACAASGHVAADVDPGGGIAGGEIGFIAFAGLADAHGFAGPSERPVVIGDDVKTNDDGDVVGSGVGESDEDLAGAEDAGAIEWVGLVLGKRSQRRGEQACDEGQQTGELDGVGVHVRFSCASRVGWAMRRIRTVESGDTVRECRAARPDQGVCRWWRRTIGWAIRTGAGVPVRRE